jgi:hypothetical protein
MTPIDSDFARLVSHVDYSLYIVTAANRATARAV